MAALNKSLLILICFAVALVLCISCKTAPKSEKNALPSYLIGEFEDDYGIKYQIDNQLFQLLPNDKFHIQLVNKAAGYFIMKNDSLNSFAPSLFTRIDYQKLNNMSPFEWAFCFSTFEEVSIKDATENVNTNKSDLMKGCNGFPFSRMKQSN